ncbi:MAG: TonB-dependent receptor [Deltaproteobacteria bacterium]|nr:TonB-dependent receptor [Deltaproteobacteria bacterium]
MTVQAERPEWEKFLSPGTVDVVVPDDFKGEQKKLPEFLKTVPGLHVESRGGEGQFTTVTMRGSTSTQVNVYVDGILQNIGGEGSVDLSLIPMNNVARIEVYRGYVPSRFQGAPIGGVINIVTKRPVGLGFTVSAGVKSLHGRNADLTLTAPLFGGSILIGAHRDQSHGDFKYTFSGSDRNKLPSCNYGDARTCTRWRMNNSYENSDVLVKWQDDSWHVKGSWKETSRYYPDPTNITGLAAAVGADPHSWKDIPSANNAIGQINTYHRYQESSQSEFLIGRRQTWGKLDFGIEASYMTQEKKFEWRHPVVLCLQITRFPGSCWNTYKTERYGLSADGSYNLNDRHLFEFRVDYSREKLRLDGNNKNSQTGGGGYNANHRDPIQYERDVIHAQLSDTITLIEKDLWLTLILRFDKTNDLANVSEFNSTGSNWDQILKASQSRGIGVVTWGVAVKKELAEGWTAQASGGTFLRHPTFYEFYGDGITIDPSGNLDYKSLQPETGHQWDFGIAWNGSIVGSRASFNATYFARTTENLISLIVSPLSGRATFVNAGDAVASGLELDIGIIHDKFEFTASGTWQETKLIRKYNVPLNTLTEANPLVLMPEWEAHARFAYRPFGDIATFFIEHHYTGPMLEQWTSGTANNDAAFIRRALHVTGAGFRYQASWGGAVTAGVDDIWNNRPRQKFDVSFSDIHYAQGVGYPSPGRTWYLTLDYTFGGSQQLGSANLEGGVSSGDARAILGTLSPDSAGSGNQKSKFRFYVSPRLIYSKNSISYGPRDLYLGPGTPSTWTGFVDPQVGVRPEDAGPLPAFPGFSRTDSNFSGGIALGIDFYEINDIPVRLELELNARSYSRTIGPGYEPGMTDCSGYGAECGYGWIVLYNGDNINTASLHARQHSVLLNFYWDFHNKSRFTPFIGAGAGFTFTRVHVKETPARAYFFSSTGRDVDNNLDNKTEESDRRTSFAWNATVGLSFQLTDSTLIDIAYRYVDSGYEYRTPGVKTDAYNIGHIYSFDHSGIDINLRKSHQIVSGLRFQF